MSFEILNRWTNAVVYQSESATELPATVIEAVRGGAVNVVEKVQPVVG